MFFTIIAYGKNHSQKIYFIALREENVKFSEYLFGWRACLLKSKIFYLNKVNSYFRERLRFPQDLKCMFSYSKSISIYKQLLTEYFIPFHFISSHTKISLPRRSFVKIRRYDRENDCALQQNQHFSLGASEICGARTLKPREIVKRVTSNATTTCCEHFPFRGCIITWKTRLV